MDIIPMRMFTVIVCGRIDKMWDVDGRDLSLVNRPIFESGGIRGLMVGE